MVVSFPTTIVNLIVSESNRSITFTIIVVVSQSPFSQATTQIVSDPVITLCDGTTSGEGDFGIFEIVDGCLVYTSGSNPGSDTICVVACENGYHFA